MKTEFEAWYPVLRFSDSDFPYKSKTTYFPCSMSGEHLILSQGRKTYRSVHRPAKYHTDSLAIGVRRPFCCGSILLMFLLRLLNLLCKRICYKKDWPVSHNPDNAPEYIPPQLLLAVAEFREIVRRSFIRY